MKKRMRPVIAHRGNDGPEPAPPDTSVLSTPFRIADLEIPNRVVQAPLAGIGNSAFRVQAHRHGAGFVVSEMVASMGLHHKNRKTRAMLEMSPDEGITAIQVFGADPAVMAEAARAVEAAGAQAVDINMGCPVPKVCKTGAGSSLLAEPELGAQIVRAMVDAVDIPVTVKMRRGVTPETSRPVELAKRFADAGAAALAVHPRAAAEEYAGVADHGITALVVEAVDIPVIASGDITTVEKAARVLDQTGCAAVMIGRGALGNPWLLGAMAGSGAGRPDLEGVIAEIESFAAAVREVIGERAACHYMRKFYPWYLAGEPVPAGDVTALLTEPTLDGALAKVHALSDAALKQAAV